MTLGWAAAGNQTLRHRGSDPDWLGLARVEIGDDRRLGISAGAPSQRHRGYQPRRVATPRRGNRTDMGCDAAIRVHAAVGGGAALWRPQARRAVAAHPGQRFLERRADRPAARGNRHTMNSTEAPTVIMSKLGVCLSQRLRKTHRFGDAVVPLERHSERDHVGSPGKKPGRYWEAGCAANLPPDHADDRWGVAVGRLPSPKDFTVLRNGDKSCRDWTYIPGPTVFSQDWGSAH